MKEAVTLFAVYLIFFLYSIVLYKKAFTIGKTLLCLLIPAYLSSIYLYFELINQIHTVLREKGIYLEFGHGSIMLIMLMLLAYLTAIVLVVLYFIRNRSINKET